MNPLLMDYSDLLSYYKPRDEIEAHLLNVMREEQSGNVGLNQVLYDFGLPHDDNAKLNQLLDEGFSKSDKYDKLDETLGKLALPSDPDELKHELEKLDARANEADALQDIISTIWDLPT